MLLRTPSADQLVVPTWPEILYIFKLQARPSYVLNDVPIDIDAGGLHVARSIIHFISRPVGSHRLNVTLDISTIATELLRSDAWRLPISC